MGLNLHLYNLSGVEPVEDRRFDSSRHSEDYFFVQWLDVDNAVYRCIDEGSVWRNLATAIGVSENDDTLLKHWARENAEAFAASLRLLCNGGSYERPKDITAARTWILEHIEPGREEGGWDRDRLLGLLDLLESDTNLWLYQSW